MVARTVFEAYLMLYGDDLPTELQDNKKEFKKFWLAHKEQYRSVSPEMMEQVQKASISSLRSITPYETVRNIRIDEWLKQ